ncbi:MAG: LysM peptidoglycan-binding domain-containing protein [Phycisphaerae bacterium]|nr:LysM peptidoglycan-binding domain-containing protein [Phycisphaerae bacterium]NIP54809.1 LysM peptidoglycan-binding domain-containing protein [Phycisphaerae bacterium]NIS54238.1 LysM peptidoglycan-binding domain-containing protein [Phycisphaerae bacterium]NIU11882.1 LysM peptidoglycan-binding domain-containing protein [Phycisphaerae bacterium]NIU60247.1 LysM peptidoglycan-binding domain-containing protein [Phycisphaerae bacterium]
MNILGNILSQEAVHKLGWTLLHSLWQGGVVVLLLVVCLRILHKSSANLRYVISCFGLAVIVLLPVATFYVVPAPAQISDVESIPGFSAPATGELTEVYDTDMLLQRATEYTQMLPTISWRQRAMNFCTSTLPYTVLGWFMGILALSLWHIGGFVRLQRLKRQKVCLVDEFLKGRLLSLAERLKVARSIKLMESALVQIPTVVGWFRPVILLPASALSGLTPEQIEALLAHELAHIRRYDYLVNMFQTVVEILGFYHPAVWWISHKIRVERENCCDDLAVSVGGDKMAYARALTSMEEIRQAQGELVIAASGGNLFTRISRLVGYESAGKARHIWTPVVLSALLIIVLAIPVTFALTAADAAGGLRADNITTHVSELVDEENINSSVAMQPASHLPETDSNIQLLFECKIYEVPADLKFLEGEQKEDKVGQMIWLGKEYADSLEALSRENKNVKVLCAPQVITLDGEETKVLIGTDVPYTAGYETRGDADDEPRRIIRKAFAGLELNMKGETIKNGLKLDLNIDYGQLKPGFGVHKDDEGREIQVPFMERRECSTAVIVGSGETIVICGLRSSEKPLSNLILTITPSIVLPEKGPQQAKIEKEVRAVDTDPGRVVEFRAAEAESERKTAKKGGEPRYHKVHKGDSLNVPGVVLDDESIEAEKAVIQAQINALEAQLIELRKNYEAEIFNRQAEWWAEMRAFTADVVAAQQRIIDANSVLEDDLATLEQMKQDIKIFKIMNGANLRTDIALYNKLKTMEANCDRLAKKIGRDRLKLAKNQKELEEAEARREQYIKYRPRAGTDPNEAQRVINLAKKALELRLSELNKLSSEQTSPKEAKSEGEPRYHIVRPGETLSSISEKYYGSENKWQDILDYNRKIITADGIQVGQKLIIPPLQASAKEPRSERERLSAMAAKFAERGDFTKAIEHLENAIEIAKAEKNYGIGLAIEKVDGLIRIGQVLPDAPASGSSFKKGDIIEAVDGVSTEGMSLNEVVAAIRGPKGTKVTLTVKSQSQDITMEETFRRQLPLKGSPALREYFWRLDAYEADKTWPQYRKIMKYYKPWSGETVHIYELKYANPKELAQLLNRILQRRLKGIKNRPKDSVRIVPDPGHNKLIIHASPADIQLIEALIAELDVLAKRETAAFKAAPDTEYKQVPADDTTITHAIKLKYADCVRLEQILRELLSHRQFRIATDERTNMLIVVGTESDIRQIMSLVAELDVPGFDMDRNVLDTNKKEKVDSDLKPSPSVK